MNPPLLTPQEVEGQVCGGGASVYYSHTLQMLFFSYSNGRCTMSKSYTSPSSFVETTIRVSCFEVVNGAIYVSWSKGFQVFVKAFTPKVTFQKKDLLSQSSQCLCFVLIAYHLRVN